MIPLDKQILVQYIDACAQVEDTKREILKLKKTRKRIEQDAVKGSSHELGHFHHSHCSLPTCEILRNHVAIQGKCISLSHHNPDIDYVKDNSNDLSFLSIF